MKNAIINYKSLSVLVTASLLFILTLWPSQPGQAQGQMTRDGVDMWNPYWMHRDRWGHGSDSMGPDHRQRMRRHWTFMHSGVPEAYRGKTNPYAITPDIIKAGSSLYELNCASCHGARGLGDGEAGKSLSPSPALLSYMIQMPMSVDEYMLWTISEGGQPFGTGMPAFKDTLGEDDMWKIVSYMRAGFPENPE